MSSLTQAHVYISGRVQKVGFRYWTKKQAQRLGLTGWVKNLPNGNVEAIFQGPKGKTEKMIEKCKQGPVWTGDNQIEVDWQKPK